MRGLCLCRSVYPSVCLSICLSVCLPIAFGQAPSPSPRQSAPLSQSKLDSAKVQTLRRDTRVVFPQCACEGRLCHLCHWRELRGASSGCAPQLSPLISTCRPRSHRGFSQTMTNLLFIGFHVVSKYLQTDRYRQTDRDTARHFFYLVTKNILKIDLTPTINANSHNSYQINQSINHNNNNNNLSG